MAIEAILAKEGISPIFETKPEGPSFKEVLETKLGSTPKASGDEPLAPLNFSLPEMIKNHDSVQKTLRSFMAKTDYTQEQLLKMQYKTGVYFLREQMLCRVAEISASTLKNFTQMQI
jgi:hypothetical protein